MVAAAELAHHVRQERPQHGQPVAHAAGRAGQVDDERPRGGACDTAGQPRRGPLLRPVPPHRLREARRLALEHRAGRLRGETGGGQPGAAGGDDDGRPGRHPLAQPLRQCLDLITAYVRSVDDEPQRAQALGERLAAAVGVDPGGGAVGGGDHHRPGAHGKLGHRTQSPFLPPDLASSRTSVMQARGSTALTMSMTASPATATDVRASISTPVRSAVRAVAVISTASSATSTSTVTPCSAIGWHSGTRSGVRLAPMIPAIRATAMASPFGTPPPRSSATTSGLTSTRPAAVATRDVTGLSVTSTIRAAPLRSTWVSRAGSMAGFIGALPRSAP